MILFRIYERQGKAPLLMLGTVQAHNEDEAITRARNGNWNARFMPEGKELPEELVAMY